MKVPGFTYMQGRNYYTDNDGKKYGIAIHCTANTATALSEAKYAQNRTDGIGSHIYVDDNDLIQSVDTIHRVNHAGSSNGNQNALCIEQTGLTSWSRQTWIDSINWDLLGDWLAYIINNDPTLSDNFQVRRASVQEMINNSKVAAFYSHDDMRRAWGGTSHTDPGSNYPWDFLFNAVNSALGNGDDEMEQSDISTGAFARPNQTIGNILADVGNERDWLYGSGPEAGSSNPPPAGSRLAVIFEAAKQIKDGVPIEIDSTQLATDIATALAADEDFLTAIANKVADVQRDRLAE